MQCYAGPVADDLGEAADSGGTHVEPLLAADALVEVEEAGEGEEREEDGVRGQGGQVFEYGVVDGAELQGAVGEFAETD